ncbi:gibberellin 2-beta-dioxygenase 1-like [Miscanthus floridulus]|uniref:gibberellin 2-beta-dioxygenase 1-like n=1 Tax=Miscanthus floridulus TaxID=154761 RepID=UPI00345862E0
MVVPSTTTPVVRQETPPQPPSHDGIPTVDLSAPGGRGALSRQVARACAEHGFFRAVNHGVPPGPAARLDAAARTFFALPPHDKQRAGPPSPLGYGCRTIGFNGDAGELEYLLLHANPAAVAHRARSIDTDDPSRFSNVVNEYVGAMRQLACEILDLLGEGLGLKDPRSFSKLITDTDSDSLLRINHYPPACTIQKLDHENQCKMKSSFRIKTSNGVNQSTGARIGFGEHSDPQILSLLRSNDVDGLQVLLNCDGREAWVQVPADPSAFFVNVGDLLQALTNGKVISVRHRVIASSCRARLSTIYFAAPPLHARILALPETVTANSLRQYRPFTWAEYKKTMYSLRLSHSRLNLFHIDHDDHSNVGKGEQE